MKPHEGGVRRLNWELTDRCNANCVFCPREKYVKKVGQLSDMTWQDFTKSLDHVVKVFKPVFINFGVYGEPTLCDYLPDAIRQAKELGLTTRISTNAMLMDNNLAVKCLEAGLDRIHFSVDDIDKTIFEKIRKGMHFETILGNIVNFWKLKEFNGYKCRVEIYPVKCQENQDRIGDIIEFWTRFADKCRVSPEVPIGEGHRTEPWYVPWYSPLLFPILKLFKLTPHCYDWLVIRANGDIVPCCLDNMKEHILGNIFEDSVENIWVGKKAQEFKALFRHAPASLPSLCQRCRFRRFFT